MGWFFLLVFEFYCFYEFVVMIVWVIIGERKLVLDMDVYCCWMMFFCIVELIL